MFFEGSVRSTRTTRRSGRSCRSAPRRSRTASSVASASSSAGSTEIGRATVFVSPPVMAAAASANSRRQRSVWKPTRSFASRPSCTARRMSRREHAPAVDAHPRDVDEVDEPGVRAALPHGPRREIEVVVMEEHCRFRIRRELVDDGVREAAVHLRVALVPGLVKRPVQCRFPHEIPEPVLDEPQHRVGDDVVVAVVRGGVVGDETQAKRQSAPRGFVEGPSASLCGDGADPRRSTHLRST